MNARRIYGREKVDLGLVLACIVAGVDVASGEFVVAMAHHFDCSERAVNDALAVLRRGGYVYFERDERDRRRRRLRVTRRGARLVSVPKGWVILRLARRLFTTCASPSGAVFRNRLSDQERHKRLAHAEAALLGVEST